MKKSYLIIAAIASVALASCSNDEYFGDPGGLTGDKAISFDMSTPAMTRAEGAEAAEMLNNNFVVYGFKTMGTGGEATTQKVFDNYQVNYAENTANTTESNSKNWEYVAKSGTYKNVPDGVTTNKGVVTFAANTTDNANAIDQTIKYWDFSATSYDFFAYSLGKGVTAGTPANTTYATSTAMSTNTAGGTYTLTGSTAELQECYISEKIHRIPIDANKKDAVQFRFLSFNSKVRIGIYETIPGYSITDVKFYTSNTDANPGTTVTLYDADGTASIPNGGTYTVTFDDNGKPVLTFATTTGYTNEAYQGFGTLTAFDGPEFHENDGSYLRKAANAPTYAGDATKQYYTKVLPNPTGIELTLKVDYTLVSTDGSGETIKAVGGTAKVPANFAEWKPGYAYTYLFKISDNPNSTIGTVEGLYPITFDAVVLDPILSTDEQTTITTVAMPSITTYQKDHATGTNEYVAGDIYVEVMNDGSLVTNLADAGKSALYELSGVASEAEVMDALNLRASEAGTATYITGRNGLKLTPGTLTFYETDDDSHLRIPGEDDKNITVDKGKAARFTATGSTYYAYVYQAATGTPSNQNYPVVLTADPGDWVASDANIYYSDAACTTKVTTAYAAGTYYRKYTNLNNTYGVKVIKVQ